jgi:RHS repeat-associated protein
MVSAGTLYFIHPDHLGTPQRITDGSQNTVWDAALRPFGEVEQMTQTFTLNLRFPGQYADAETGLNYNFFRDYDPSVGRYVESDPIGLKGGVNTYSYGRENPLPYIDPFGLDVTVIIYPGQGGNPGGHAGISVDPDPPEGFDPTPNASIGSIITDQPVPGEVDKVAPNRTPEDSVTIRTTPEQDKAIRDYLEEKAKHPGPYRIRGPNCATMVHDALKAGGINSPETMWPRTLISGLKGIRDP